MLESTTTETWCSSWRSVLNTISAFCEKTSVKIPSVTFMGHKLIHKGAKLDPAKVAAIREMTVPTDKAAVHRFQGMCQYLSKFCHNLSETVLPLRNFSKDDSALLWSESHETALNSAKSPVASTTGPLYYNPHLPVTLQVNASDNAIGGVSLQEGHPVRLTSHTLTNTERNYAQIEKLSCDCILHG